MNKAGRARGGMLATLAMAAMMSDLRYREYDSSGDNATTPKDIDTKLKLVLPKGCEWYYFYEGGEMSEKEDGGATFFKCIAANSKNAIRKFNKYKSQQTK